MFYGSLVSKIVNRSIIYLEIDIPDLSKEEVKVLVLLKKISLRDTRGNSQKNATFYNVIKS